MHKRLVRKREKNSVSKVGYAALYSFGRGKRETGDRERENPRDPNQETSTRNLHPIRPRHALQLQKVNPPHVLDFHLSFLVLNLSHSYFSAYPITLVKL
jgi:hypothetical protein